MSSLFLIVFNAFDKLSVAKVVQSLTTLFLPNFSDIKLKHHHKFIFILSMENMKDAFFCLHLPFRNDTVMYLCVPHKTGIMTG